MKSSHFCKLAVTASLVMGIISGAQAAGSNTAKVTFLGNIVDSPCSVTLDTEDQTVNMGSSIGNGTLSNGKTTINNARTFHIDLEGCTWATEKNMNVVFTTGSGTTAATGATDNLALMKTDGTGAISNVSLAIGDAGKNNIKLGDTYTQAIADLDGDTILDEKQSLNFTAWLVGAATGTVGTGEFSSAANVTISYL
ncbi:fimbrial protein [Salmonella enterica subsp. enterica serovar Havana]|uniref:Fimbrial protein n=3 Tax=Salmonella enterica I TaxID=59201 RepID=A0A3Y6UWS9_SALET|nr:fimbrial protein [Salmonella enterica]EBL1803460.1 fimbrial protein SteA [Salmonella enterica subsp. enterica serovar Rubislaw]EBU2366691.1 fimbrial protein SteA [Salmonella enterica subsp. enterica]EDH6606541.1 fimbrial protein SteA [Salmonella enterica subsp. enterica serovar Gambia]EEB7258693.1 fimbrial protein [Salmonella enterica subsp. enterica serovar Senftenberg]EED5351928.1 fimbrial protein [Salmonella enterica subsp. enterica serovar Kentucky]EEJ6225209.1 fimbrial protein [Salmon